MVIIVIILVIIGLIIGFSTIYFTASKSKIIVKYPTLDNIKDTTYIDENGQCYKYYAKEVACNISP